MPLPEERLDQLEYEYDMRSLEECPGTCCHATAEVRAHELVEIIQELKLYRQKHGPIA